MVKEIVESLSTNFICMSLTPFRTQLLDFEHYFFYSP